MKNSQITIVVMLAIVFVTTLASAEFFACFTKGEKINYCNPLTPDRTCDSVMGCTYCMSKYNESAGCYSQGNINVCNYVSQVCQNNGTGANGTIDSSPPNITLINPIEGKVYNTRNIIFNLRTDEYSDIYFTDVNTGRGKWTAVCRNCPSYNNQRGFKEGLNQLIIKATDPNGNTGYQNVSFFIDSKKPVISKTAPKSGFASGDFEVQFSETNPSSMILTYGNVVEGMRTNSVDLSTCTSIGSRKNCLATVDLSDYDAQSIQYYFTLKDIANISTSSKPVNLKVDTTAPVFNSIKYNVSGTTVLLNLSITEPNLDKLTYIDNSALRPTEKTLCSALKNGVCTKKITLSRGIHSITIIASDDAGNSVAQNLPEITI